MAFSMAQPLDNQGVEVVASFSSNIMAGQKDLNYAKGVLSRIIGALVELQNPCV